MRDDDARRMISAYREVTVPAERARAAMLERLLAEGEAGARGVGRLVASIGISVAVAAAVLLVLHGGHAAIMASRAERARADAAMYEAREDGAAEAATVDAPPPRRPRARPEAAVSPEVVPSRPSIEEEPPAAPPARRAAAPAPVDDGERLLEEGRLLARAQSALSAGDPGEALRLLERHRREFAAGAMVLERRALQAIALCEAERRTEGRMLAEQLLTEHPSTPHRPRIARACGE